MTQTTPKKLLKMALTLLKDCVRDSEERKAVYTEKKYQRHFDRAKKIIALSKKVKQ